MRTELPQELLATDKGKRADAILRSCVHCGFCLPACPTYLDTGDELDSPRGRIVLIQAMLEAGSGNKITATHLDRCLTCQACETACPSNVAYKELLDIGRETLETTVRRTWFQRWRRVALRLFLPRPTLFSWSYRILMQVRGLLPQALGNQLHSPIKIRYAKMTPPSGAPAVLLLPGCVQSSATPNTLQAAKAVLNHLGVRTIIASTSCCGALEHHLGAPGKARQRARQNIRQWSSMTDIQAILSTASGCGAHIQGYPGFLDADEPGFPVPVMDIGRYLQQQDPAALPMPAQKLRIAWQVPCTLQHGLRNVLNIPEMLRTHGHMLVPTSDDHLCCGSAGAYSLEQPAMSRRLRQRKLMALLAGKPDVIATANVGCQLHLQAEAGIPVKHWLEILAAGLEERNSQ